MFSPKSFSSRSPSFDSLKSYWSNRSFSQIDYPDLVNKRLNFVGVNVFNSHILSSHLSEVFLSKSYTRPGRPHSVADLALGLEGRTAPRAPPGCTFPIMFCPAVFLYSALG